MYSAVQHVVEKRKLDDMNGAKVLVRIARTHRKEEAGDMEGEGVERGK